MRVWKSRNTHCGAVVLSTRNMNIPASNVCVIALCLIAVKTASVALLNDEDRLILRSTKPC